MAFDWAAAGAGFAGRLNIRTMGGVGGNSPNSRQVTTNNATVTFVDQLGLQATISEAVSGSKVLVTRTGDAPGNAYVLPWSANYASKTTLATAATMFVTPDLNGCAVFISGTAAAPTVVHANTQPALLDVGEPQFAPMRKGASTAEINAAGALYGARMTAFKREYKNPMWDAVYQALAIKLVNENLIPGAGLKLLLPTDYLAEDVDSAAVFGYRAGGGWSFFLNVKQTTTQLWP